MDNVIEVFCPVCKLKNESSATVCVYCQSPIPPHDVNRRTTQRVGGETQVFDTNELKKRVGIPTDGIMILSQESGQEIEVVKDSRFVLGRKVENVDERIVDLSAFGAYGLGVSRLHALIQRTRNGYEISDMDSTNGTWLNDQQLVPNRFYPLTSGDRMGKMYIIVLFGHA